MFVGLLKCTWVFNEMFVGILKYRWGSFLFNFCSIFCNVRAMIYEMIDISTHQTDVLDSNSTKDVMKTHYNILHSTNHNKQTISRDLSHDYDYELRLQ